MERSRISYRRAIAWIAHNDDTSDLHESVPLTGAMVAALTGRSQTEVLLDLRRYMGDKNMAPGPRP